MPAKVPTLLLKGLAEGLTLRSAERQPVDTDGLVDRFERLLDRRPHGNQVGSVLRDLDDRDLVRRSSDDPDEGYRLTQDGARRLEVYRRLPDAFKRELVHLFRIDPRSLSGAGNPSGEGVGDRSSSSSTTSPASSLAASPASGPSWVRDVLDRLPDDVEIQAEYAQVSLDRDPAARAWTLTVERHEPGRYEGAQACPLTFLYEAATRLVADARGPVRSRGEPGPAEPSHPGSRQRVWTHGFK